MNISQSELISHRKVIKDDIKEIENTIIKSVGISAYKHADLLSSLNYNMLLWKSIYKNDINDQSRELLREFISELPGPDILPNNKLIRFIDTCISTNEAQIKVILGDDMNKLFTKDLQLLKFHESTLKCNMNSTYGIVCKNETI